MDRRKFLGAVSGTALASTLARAASPQPHAKKGVMLFDRLGPSSQKLYICNADGSGERELLSKSVFDYHASVAADGKWVVFTSERVGLGEADIWRANIDGSDIRQLTTDPAVDDRAAISPDGSMIAFVSTRGDKHRANIWVQNLKSGQLRNLTGGSNVQGDLALPDGFFCPAWSPDGKWLAFSSDRNTKWRGHDDNVWEHTQELSIYVIGVDGKGFRLLADRPDFTLGSPRWSPDGKRVVFYECSVQSTWDAHRPESIAKAVSQIISVDVATGQRFAHTEGSGLKLFPQYLSATEIAYHVKGNPDEGLYYTSGRPAVKRVLRSPVWTPDGSRVIYEKSIFKPTFPQNTPFYSWDPDYDYQYTDSFPTLSRDGKTLAIANVNDGGALVIMNPDGSDRRVVFASPDKGRPNQPSWSPDDQWIAFANGGWFYFRATQKNVIMRVRRDGSGAEVLTDGNENAGFPGYSADGKEIVYRVYGEPSGLRIVNVDTKKVRVLTNAVDNLPSWSPDGKLIVFTRNMGGANFDVFTIRPDGTDLRRLTDSGANDGHAVWRSDGKILYSSGMYGFKDEAALYDNTFQPYGGIFIMNVDGSGKRLLTDSPWEDAQPVYVLNPGATY
jgi:Tol biopolymer transport system component